MNYLDLPVYRHKDLILSALEKNQVIVVESPTGSGKTTQMPVILYEAGYAKRGLIGITQPRRIAALSVSEFIARQMGLSMPGLVGYKMRFEDKTGDDTKIKIMTDGILLQEMKLDPWLSKYDCMVIDEAHERSLTIDFILGLLKRILDYRSEFKVIISSATINAELFSAYFSDCPVVKIDAIAYPVTLIYDPAAPERPEERRREAPGFSGRGAADSRAAESRGSDDVLLDKICAITGRVIDEGREGDILIFLPGEKLIKSCMQRLASLPLGRRLHLAPLYGRLGKEEQEKVFERAPPGKTKAVIATNIAETSVTIDGVTTVIDSGLSKLNHYNPRTFTASLVEGPISKASANQRRGRAGRTRSGTCYRLYTRRDFENRPLFTTEEIYRTDLSEVVLRMADLGITSYEEFDFISPPGREGLIAAIETLKLLDALEDDLSLSKTGKMMTAFPLLPRQSRIIVEAIRNYPGVIEETIIAAAFLSTQSPYVLPPGEELDARKAHHRFRDSEGDFVSYLKLYRSYKAAPDKAGFCEQYYLDERAMAEIANVCSQLEETVSALGVPLGSGGPVEQYLSSVARGLIQFVCVREDKGGERRGSSPGRSMYRSLTAKGILIHPGSVMFKSDPPFIVAGEIVRTTRMYAMSVSPLSRESLRAISPGLFESVKGGDRARKVRDFTNNVRIGNEVFAIETVKGKKQAVLPWEKLSRVKGMDGGTGYYKGLRGVITLRDKYAILGGEKLSLILALAPALDLDAAPERAWPRKRNFSSGGELPALTKTMPLILAPAPWKTRGGQAGRELGFLSLFTDNSGNYWFRCSRGFSTALNESLSSLEVLIDELGDDVDVETKHEVNQCYRRLSDLLG